MTDEPAHREEPSSEHLSVLEALSSKLGTAAKLSLKDEDSEDGGSPVLKPASDAVRAALPKGKGNYQLMGEIARGGMGMVLKGHDTDLGRDVAIKVLHEDLSDDPAILQRFVEEAQIGGQLQHPGIVPVYELGLMADERPYFTMKLVKGRTLSTLLSERDDLDQDRRGFLRIFEQVCQTMGYAHSRDVIHRDLKPSNIMVGAFGEVQVVDWGLAKVLRRGGSADDAQLEQQTGVSVIETVRSGSSTTGTDSVAGAVLGTPAYMSPEQAQGKVEDLDERCDVFTLGGVLCQILTGQPPYPGDKRFAMAQAAAANQDQVRDRLAECGADPELVALAGRCLSKDPSDRPRNAGRVAKRIGTYLASLEERARRAEIEVAEARVRAQDERKARRLTVALALSAVTVLIVGAGSWIWIAGVRAERRETLLAQETERERTEQAQITERRRGIEGLVSAALGEAAFSRARGDWRSARTAVERARGHLEDEPDPDLELRIEREVQRQASDESLAAEERERGERLAQFIDGLERNRGDLWLVSNPDYRIAAFEKAFVDFGIDLTFLSEEEVVGASRESGRPADIARALDDLARFHAAVVSGTAPRLLRFAMAMDPDPVRTSVREAVLEQDEERILALADERSPGDLSPTTALVLAGALQPGLEKERCIRILGETARRHPDDFHLHVLLGELLLDRDPSQALLHVSVAQGLQPRSPYVLQLLGRVLRETGDPEEASRYLREALAIHPGEPQTHIHLGLALRDGGDEEGALENFQAASEVDPGCLEDYVSSHMRCSRDFYNKGLFDQSAWYARRAIEVNEESERGHHRLGTALKARGLLDEAIESFRRTIDINPSHRNANNSLGNALLHKGLLDEAIESFRRQIDINANHEFAYNNLGNALCDKGLYEEAIQNYRFHIDFKPRDPLARMNLAEALYYQGSYDAALESFGRATEIDPEYCYSLHSLSWFLAHVPDAELQDASEAVRLAEKCVERHVDYPVYGNVHALAPHWVILGMAYYRTDRLEECVDALVKALDLSPDAASSYDSFSRATASFFLAMAHHKLGAPGEALKWYDASVNWMESHELTVPQESDLSRWRDEAQTVLGR